MQLETCASGGALVVTVMEERIDAAATIGFKEAVRRAVANGPARVVLDFSRVGFLDSSGLGALVGLLKELAPARRLELAALRPPVDRVLRLTRMDQVFTLHASTEAALNAPAAEPSRHAC